MLLRSETLPDWHGEPIKTDDPREHLLVAAQNLGLVQYNDHDLSAWKYGVQGIGNWLLWRAMLATFVAAFLLFVPALALHWPVLATSLILGGLIFFLAAEICVLGFRWRTEYFGPGDPNAPPLTPNLQHIVSGMTLQWQRSGQACPLGFAAEYLWQPFWHRRRVCIFQIYGVSKQTRLVVALRAED